MMKLCSARRTESTPECVCVLAMSDVSLVTDYEYEVDMCAWACLNDADHSIGVHPTPHPSATLDGCTPTHGHHHPNLLCMHGALMPTMMTSNNPDSGLDPWSYHPHRHLFVQPEFTKYGLVHWPCYSSDGINGRPAFSRLHWAKLCCLVWPGPSQTWTDRIFSECSNGSYSSRNDLFKIENLHLSQR